tara:strand:- start:37 stop:528 length:492 start_codon:yes stop_codon:yes gene_type:complete
MSQPVPIAGYEGRYTIYPDGRVWSRFGKGKFLSHRTSKGYTRVGLYKANVKKNKLVHRLLAEAYIPNPEGKPFIDHIDRDRANNSLNNLRWVTHQENNQNAALYKTNKTGILGVYYRKALRKKWSAYINIDGKRKAKCFATKDEAIAWRKEMELAHYIQPPAI